MFLVPHRPKHFLFYLLVFSFPVGLLAQNPPELRALYAEGNYDAVLALAGDSSFVSGPDDALIIAQSQQALLRHDQAIQTLLPFVTDSSNASLLLAIGRSYAASGEPLRAIPVFERVVERDSTNRGARAGLAELHSRTDDWKKAVNEYGILLSADSLNGYLWGRLGKGYEELGESMQAVIHYERARRLQPGNAGLLLTLINVYYGREEYVSALRVADSGIEQFPEEPRFFKRKGDVLNHQERFPEAIEAFDSAISLGDTTNANLYRNKGIAHYSSGDHSGAVSALLRSFQLEDSDEITTFYLGISYQDMEEYGLAHEYLDLTRSLLLESYPVTIVNYLVQSGTTFAMQGNLEAAEKAFKTLGDLYPVYRDTDFHLAVLYDQFDRHQAALRLFERFLNTRGGSPAYRIYAERRIPTLKELVFFEGE